MKKTHLLHTPDDSHTVCGTQRRSSMTCATKRAAVTCERCLHAADLPVRQKSRLQIAVEGQAVLLKALEERTAALELAVTSERADVQVRVQERERDGTRTGVTFVARLYGATRADGGSVVIVMHVTAEADRKPQRPMVYDAARLDTFAEQVAANPGTALNRVFTPVVAQLVQQRYDLVFGKAVR